MTDDRDPQFGESSGGGYDDQAALDRLRALTAPSTPAASDEPPAQPRPVKKRFNVRSAASKAASSSRARVSSGDRQLSLARIGVPAVFLIAVIVLIVLLVQTGMVGGEGSILKPTVAPSTGPALTDRATISYKVRKGDTLSSIANRYKMSTADLETLNPKLKNTTTLTVGQRVRVLKPTPAAKTN